ncbi:MAG: AI-2E family transporter [Bacteroidota bacterium]
MSTHHPIASDERYPFWLRAPVILLGLILLFIVLYYGKFILMPLAFAGFFSMLLSPIVSKFESWRLGKIASILFTLILVAVLLAGVVSLISVQMVQFSKEIPEVTERLKTLANNTITYVENTLGITQEQQSDFVEQGVNNLIDQSGRYLNNILSATTNAFTLATLIPIYMFFMLYYREMYQRFLRMIFERRKGSNVDAVTLRVQQVTQNYLIGLLSVMGILAVLNTTGLLLIGLENAIFFGVFAALVAIIPYIGTILGGLLPTLYAFLFTDSLVTPLLVIAVFAVVQFLEGNVISPRIVGSKVAINPFVAMIALIIGGQIWGISGMILFVPLVGILRVVFDQREDLKPYGYLLGNKVETDPD